MGIVANVTTDYDLALKKSSIEVEVSTPSFVVSTVVKTISLKPEDISYTLLGLDYSYVYIELDAFIDSAGRYKKVLDEVNYTDHNQWSFTSLKRSESSLNDYYVIDVNKKFTDVGDTEENLVYQFDKKLVDTYSISSLPKLSFYTSAEEEIIVGDAQSLNFNFLLKSNNLVDDYVGVPDGLTFTITRSTKDTIQSFDEKEFYLETTKHDTISANDSGTLLVLQKYTGIFYFAESYIYEESRQF